MTVEAALGAEMEDHVGYAKKDEKDRGSGNRRNGISRKRLKGDHGEIEIEAPRDRNASFEPHSLKLVAWKDYRAVTQGLKEIDQSVCETEASAALDDIARTWDSKNPQISKSWRHHWDNLILHVNAVQRYRFESLSMALTFYFKFCQLCFFLFDLSVLLLLTEGTRSLLVSVVSTDPSIDLNNSC